MIPMKRYEKVVVIGLSDKNDLNLNKRYHANDNVCLVNVNILYSDPYCRLPQFLNEKVGFSSIFRTLSNF